MDASGIVGREADAGFAANEQTLASSNERDGCRRSRRCDRDPALTGLRKRDIQPLFEAKLVDVEHERSVLVRDRDAHRPHTVDAGFRFIAHNIVLSYEMALNA